MIAKLNHSSIRATRPLMLACGGGTMSDTILMRHTLVHAVTEYDRKQSTRKYYNRYALAQYLAAIEDVTNAVNCGSTRRDALVSKFNGRLLDVCLKALNMDKSTREEQMGSLYTTTS